MNREEKIKIIKEQIADKIRPVLVFDGGNIEFVDYSDDDVLQVKLLGHCHGCAMSGATLKYAVEGVLKEYIPDIKEVIAIEYEEDEIEL
jgi:Fe-S cluster biogenesis protein NfuA